MKKVPTASSDCLLNLIGIFRTSQNWTVQQKYFFKSGPERWVIVQTRQAALKMPLAPWHYPKKERLRRGNKRSPSKEGLSLEGRYPEAQGGSAVWCECWAFCHPYQAKSTE